MLLDDGLATTIFAEPFRLGWVETESDVRLVRHLSATQVGSEEIALVPGPEFSLLVDSHMVCPDIAVVSSAYAAVSMRSPGRPDSFEEAVVSLFDTSATGELLARALIWPYFGIRVSGWTDGPDAAAQISIIEGPEAIVDPEAGYAEDLGHAWFVMTGMPVVSHVLVAPRRCDSETLQRAIEAFRASQRVAHERRRELRLILDERLGVPRERFVSYFAQQQYHLCEADKRAFAALMVKGAGGSRYLPISRIAFSDDLPVTEQES
ncbi:hypothetical protein BH23CHL5_BH23CHL5_23350 [soil metagenome]